ncbi:MAG TPA: L,D-transpeptidase [Chloroflexota bacterium]|nr:L,D-transpeptidase [Chloroflexota bacterium]
MSRGLGLAAIIAILAAIQPMGIPRASALENGSWLQNFNVTTLWSAPGEDAEAYGTLRQFSYVQTARAPEGDRVYVFNPRTQNFAYVDVKDFGPSSAPPPDYMAEPTATRMLHMPARVNGRSLLYDEPSQAEGTPTWPLDNNHAITVEAEVRGDDGATWYRLEEGGYLKDEDVRLPRAVTQRPGRWIDADLRSPVLVTAYENGKPVRTAMAVTGTAAWPTPVGEFVVQRRVANETMSSDTIGIPRNGPGGYYLTNVLYTQYFTGSGHSIHYNYWAANWGYSGSHGCLGMDLEDAQFFWNWATVGTPLSIHY